MSLLKKMSLALLALSTLAGVLLVPASHVAATTLEQEIGKKLTKTQQSGAGVFNGVTQACFEFGQCTLCDMLIVLITISNIILRIFVGVALVFFIWGAGYLVLSSGNEQMINKGKGIIRATIIGSIIILAAWQLMSFIVILIANGNVFKEDEKVTGNPLTGWYQVADSCAQKS